MAETTPTVTMVVIPQYSLRQDHVEILRELGQQEILQASSGTEAWSMVKRFKIDLIMSTWKLKKDMSGMGLLKVVRSDPDHHDIPFMLLVQQITKEHVILAAQAGVTEILVVPFSRETLQKKIEQALKPEEDPQILKTQKYLEQGEVLMKNGRFDEALVTFQRLLSVSERAEIYFNIGYIKTAQKKYEEALMAFKKATLLNRAFAQAYQKMGEVYKKLGKADDAQKYLSMAAEIYLDKQMDEKAEKAFLKVLEVNPNTSNIFNSLGIVYRRQGKFEDGVRMYRKALKVNPFDEHIMYNLARCYLGVNKNADALQTLRQALNLNPDFVEARNLLNSIRMGQGI